MQTMATQRVYPADFEQRIGFTPIREEIASFARSEYARGMLEGLSFSTDSNWIADEQSRLRECLRILRLHQEIPLDGFPDIPGGVIPLQSEEAWFSEEALHALRGLALAYAAFAQILEANSEYEALTAMLRGVEPMEENLAVKITTLLDSQGELRDSASPELQSIRRKIAGVESEMDARFRSVLRALVAQDAIEPGTQLSVRGGRTVIPLPAVSKGKLRGVVVERSASGQTLFVVPYEILDIELQLEEFLNNERAECIRILRAFTSELRPLAEPIVQMVRYVYAMDGLLARARYAVEVYGASPILEPTPSRITLRDAHHPLLLRRFQRAGRAEDSVPLNVELSPQERILVISGPNAGGKSVCLKSIALAVYMHQCGFLPFLSDNSELSVFQHLYLDIGDKQSIENDLSTFSSHLLALKHIVSHASEGDLFLIDELGSGTEPHAGGALAEALLECLERSGAVGVVTTHFGNLKKMATTHTAIINGAMRFDREHLQPLYQLETHVMGSSFTFAIARKMGLDPGVVTRAEELAGTAYVELEQMLESASQDRLYWAAQRKSIDRLAREARGLQGSVEEAHREIEAQRKVILSQAKAEAKEIIRQSNREVERTIREIKESQAERDATRRARERLNRVQEGLASVEERVEGGKSRSMVSLREGNGEKKSTVTTEKAQPRAVLEVGSWVAIDGNEETVGEVVTLNDKSAVVALGHMLTTLPLVRITLLSRKARRAKGGTHERNPGASVIQEKRLNFSSDLDIRGERAQEAERLVNRLIDDAIIAGVHRVRILHGKGTGALQSAVREALRGNSQVASFQFEDERLGGAGITVVNLV